MSFLIIRGRGSRMVELERNKDAERLKEKNVELPTSARPVYYDTDTGDTYRWNGSSWGLLSIHPSPTGNSTCLVDGLECEVLRIEQRVDIKGSTITVKANFHIGCGNEYQVEWLGKVYKAECVEAEMKYAGKIMQVKAKFRLSENLIKSIDMDNWYP